MTISELYNYGKAQFIHHDKNDQLLDTRLLLEYTLECDFTYILLNGSKIIEKQLVSRYQQYIEQRIKGIPYQHIVGKQAFMDLEFAVNEYTLIPRKDTEVLVELANEIIKAHDYKNILDIGTGTGCIPISICYYNEKVNAKAIDISKEALEIAKYNARQYTFDNRINFINSNLFDELSDLYYNSFDVITSNPPYIPTRDIDGLMDEVKLYEPILALDGGIDGLDFYRKISNEAYQYLKAEGHLIYEIGHDQYDGVRYIMTEAGYVDIQYRCDLAGIKRIIYGRKK